MLVRWIASLAFDVCDLGTCWPWSQCRIRCLKSLSGHLPNPEFQIPILWTCLLWKSLIPHLILRFRYNLSPGLRVPVLEN